MRAALGAALAAAVLLSGCAPRLVPAGVPSAPPAPSRPAPDRPAQPTPATPLPPMPSAPAPADSGTARQAGVVVGPLVSSLPFEREQARLALQAFRISCPALLRRSDKISQMAEFVSQSALSFDTVEARLSPLPVDDCRADNRISLRTAKAETIATIPDVTSAAENP